MNESANILSTMNLNDLNKDQKDAVTTGLGPVLVLAGAGSGKTKVLTYRVAFLIAEGLFAPENILTLTFTNKAAKEMQHRLVTLISDEKRKTKNEKLANNKGNFSNVNMPTMGTFHSVGARILRKEIYKLGYSSGFTILDSEDQNKVIKEVLKERSIETKFTPGFFHHQISVAKNLLKSPAEFTSELPQDLSRDVQNVYAGYQDFLFKQNSLDFDDLIFLTVKLFDAFPETAFKYSNIFKYILVDEYQDTNSSQYQMLKQLTVAHSDDPTKSNLYVVGDDAQSIYGFRGSDIRNILEFEKDFPGASVFRLEQNYRSTKHILMCASAVIKLNAEQKPKELWTDNPAGERVWLEEASDETAEAAFVASKIVSLSKGEELDMDEDDVFIEETPKVFSILDTLLASRKMKGLNSQVGFSSRTLPKFLPSLSKVSLDNFVVLYRTHAQSRALEEMFMASGIPYQIVGGLRFYERKEIKDLLAYLRLVANPKDLISFNRVINYPVRGVGEKGVDKLIEAFTRNGEWGVDGVSGLTAKAKDGASKFFSLLNSLRMIQSETTLSELLKTIIKAIGIKEQLLDKTEAGQERWENVRELINVTTKFDEEKADTSLPAFLEEVTLISDVDTMEDSSKVSMMSLHTAKGLEFDYVFFVGLEEGLLPHSRSIMEPAELSEEIRLAYVGITRAKKQLFMSFARSRNMYGKNSSSMPSRILRTLPESAVYKRNAPSVPTEGELEYELVDE